MSNGRLRVTLIGKLYLDPDVQQSRHGIVVNLSIPTTELWTDKNTGTQLTRTEWSRVAVFNRNAEVAAAYLRKGSGVYIEGTIRTEKITDPRTGTTRYASKLICQVLELTDAPEAQSPCPASTATPAVTEPINAIRSGVMAQYSYSYEWGADSSSFPGSYDSLQSSLR